MARHDESIGISLQEVITLTEELIAAAQAEENPDVAQAVAAVAAEGEKLVSRGK